MDKDYKQYNSTVKSVLVACEQASGGCHLSEGDLRALNNAIYDLTSLYNTRIDDSMNALELKEF